MPQSSIMEGGKEDPMFFSIRNNLNWTRLLIMALLSWVGGLGILYLDAWTVDWIAVLTVAISAFTLVLGVAMDVGKVKQKVDDQGELIKTIDGRTWQILEHLQKK